MCLSMFAASDPLLPYKCCSISVLRHTQLNNLDEQTSQSNYRNDWGCFHHWRFQCQSAPGFSKVCQPSPSLFAPVSSYSCVQCHATGDYPHQPKWAPQSCCCGCPNEHWSRILPSLEETSSSRMPRSFSSRSFPGFSKAGPLMTAPITLSWSCLQSSECSLIGIVSITPVFWRFLKRCSEL